MTLGEEKPAAKEKGVAAAPDKPQLAKFRQASDEWKQLHGDLLTLKSQYRSADAAQRGEIRKKWDELVAKAPALQDQLIAAAEAAYLEAPNKNENVVNLLMTVLAERVNRDDSEAAYVLGKMLLDKKCEDRRLHLLVAAAAFENGDFDEAQRLLNIADKERLAHGRDRQDERHRRVQERVGCAFAGVHRGVQGGVGKGAEDSPGGGEGRRLAARPAENQPRRHRTGAFRKRSPQQHGELHHPGGKGLLQRLDVSSRAAGLHGPGGRSEGRRQRRAGLHHRRRVHQAGASLALPRQPGDGPFRGPRQRRLAVLHDVRAEQLVGRQVHGLWADRQGIRRVGEDSAPRPRQARRCPSPTRSSRRKCCGNAITSTR